MGDDTLHPAPPVDPRPIDSEDYINRAVARVEQITKLLRDAQIPDGTITALALTMMAARESMPTGLSVIDGIRVYLQVYENTETSFNRSLQDAMFSTLRETVSRVTGLPKDKKDDTTH